MSFETLGLSPVLLRALAEIGYATPTPIQSEAIPLALAGHDLLGGAQTGTGKTAALYCRCCSAFPKVPWPARRARSARWC